MRSLGPVLGALWIGACLPDDGEQGRTEPAELALIELFTSEGCNSCPPADENLIRAVDTYGDNLIAVAWHVTYWNGLGWPDPFSHPRSDARQDAYEPHIVLWQRYTPQIVANASTQFNGTLEGRTDGEIAIGLRGGVQAEVTLASPEAPVDDRLVVEATVEGAPAGAILHVVVVQSGLTSSPTAGENAGATLHHSNVARASTQADAVTGTVELDLPADLGSRSPDLKLVAWIQDPADFSLYGGAQLPLDWWY